MGDDQGAGTACRCRLTHRRTRDDQAIFPVAKLALRLVLTAGRRVIWGGGAPYPTAFHDGVPLTLSEKP